MDVSERLNAFDEMHGNAVREECWIYFEDGARREVNPYGALISPPEDDWKRSKKILFYHRIIPERAQKAFLDRKTKIKIAAKVALKQKYCAPAEDTERVRKELMELQEAVRKAQENFNKARQNALDAKPEDMKQKEIEDGQNRTAQENVLSEIEKIEI